MDDRHEMRRKKYHDQGNSCGGNMIGIGKWLIKVLLVGLFLPGCTLTPGPSADDIAAGLARVPETGIIRDGLPAYIIMIESLLNRTPENPELLEAAARLYSLYGGYFVDEQTRAENLTTRALDYALIAADRRIPGMGLARSSSYQDFKRLVNNTVRDDIDTLFFIGSIWLDWVRVRRDELDAVADLPMIQLLMQRIAVFEAGYHGGMATLYLALLASMEDADNDQIRGYFALASEQAAGKHLLVDYFFGVWQVENGEMKEGCARLYDILDNRQTGASVFSLYNDLARTQVPKALEAFRQQGNCSVSDRKGERIP